MFKNQQIKFNQKLKIAIMTYTNSNLNIVLFSVLYFIILFMCYFTNLRYLNFVITLNSATHLFLVLCRKGNKWHMTKLHIFDRKYKSYNFNFFDRTLHKLTCAEAPFFKT